MTRHLLDTSFVSAFIDRAHPQRPAALRWAEHAEGELSISILTFAEIALGARIVPSLGTAQAIVVALWGAPVPIGEAEALVFAELKHVYAEAVGAKIAALARHNIDFLIAATAIARDAVLVSNDQIFTKLAASTPQLRLQSWVTA